MTLSFQDQRNLWLSKAESRQIQLDQIVLHPDYQMRAEGLSESHVIKLVDAIESGNSEIPAVTVMEIEGRFFLVDGYHRVEALNRCNVLAITVKTIEGRTHHDALRFSLTSNLDHGKPAGDLDIAASIDKALRLDGEAFTESYSFDSRAFASHYGFSPRSVERHSVDYRGHLESHRNEQVIKLSADGSSQRDVAKRTGVSRATVQNILRGQDAPLAGKSHPERGSGVSDSGIRPEKELTLNKALSDLKKTERVAKGYYDDDDEIKKEPMTNEHMIRHVTHVVNCISWHENQFLKPKDLAKYAREIQSDGLDYAVYDILLAYEFFKEAAETLMKTEESVAH